MAKSKYQYLVKPLNPGKAVLQPPVEGAPADGPGQAVQKIRLNGRDHLEGLELSINWGLYQNAGPWHAVPVMHTHPYPEVHIIAGLDTANINYLGAEVKFAIGEDPVSFTFDEPTVIVVPAGVPHGQAETRRIFSPKGFCAYLVALSAVPETRWLKKVSRKAGRAELYQNLVKLLKSFILIERGKVRSGRFSPAETARRSAEKQNSGMSLGPGNADNLAWLFGKTDLEGLKVNLDWGFFSRPGLWHRGVGAHVHDCPEVLLFVGTDPADINRLGAEIEIDLGKEHERYVINQPTVVVLPAGTPHGPFVTRWVDRPFGFSSINLASESVMRFID